jgi:hypothetical protein
MAATDTDDVDETAAAAGSIVPGETRAFRIVAYVSALMAALVTRKALRAAWKFVTGRRPPANPESPDTNMGEAVSWALVTGMVIGVVRMLATRRVAKVWAKSAERQAAAMQGRSQ